MAALDLDGLDGALRKVDEEEPSTVILGERPPKKNGSRLRIVVAVGSALVLAAGGAALLRPRERRVVEAPVALAPAAAVVRVERPRPSRPAPVDFPGRFAINRARPLAVDETDLTRALARFDSGCDVIVLTGHTCALGNPRRNLRLGFERAASVERLLLDRGIAARRIVLESSGAYEPIAKNARAPVNRRVTISCQKKEGEAW
jgi:hypothetical protein